MTNILEAKNIHKTYTSLFLNKEKVKALKGINFKLEKGGILGLLGPNGAGKTTLVKILTGLVQPTRGKVYYYGMDFAKKEKEIKSNIGVLLEGNRNIYMKLTCTENLRYFGRMKGIANKKELDQRVDELLDFFNLDSVRNRLASDLSRGMMQKLALAITLINDPEIVFLDEPTLGLDVYARQDLLRLIRKLSQKYKKSIIITSHMLDVVEELVDRVLIINEGEIIINQDIELIKELYAKNTFQLTVRNNDKDKILSSLNGFIKSEKNKNGMYKYHFLIEDRQHLYYILQQVIEKEIKVSRINSEEIRLEDIFLLLTGGEDHGWIKETG